MRPYDTTVLQDAIATIEKTVNDLLLTSSSLQRGAEIDVDEILHLLPDLQLTKYELQSELDGITKEAKISA